MGRIPGTRALFLITLLLTAPAHAQETHGHGPGNVRRGLDGRIETLVAFAEGRSPELRAALERWRAATARIGVVGRLPEPMVDIGTFAWTSGGDVAPALSRVAIRQELPWPRERRAERDAATAEAEALELALLATWLDLRQRVITGAIEIWRIGEQRRIELEQLVLLRGLSEIGRGALATGTASLADQQQLDLAVTRLEDSIAARREHELAARIRLRATIGAPPTLDLGPIDAPAKPTRPAEHLEDLAAALLEHPEVLMRIAMANAAEAMGRRHQALGLPGFGVGVEWMRMPAAMGEQAVSPMLSIRVPLGRDRHRDGAHGADAERLAWLADRELALLRGRAELEAALVILRDSTRRFDLHEHTLLPQAEAAWLSVLGSYTANRGGGALALMAQRELLEIQMGLAEARADHAMAWAKLEAVVGRRIEPESAPPSPVPGPSATDSSPPSPVPPSRSPTRDPRTRNLTP